MNRNSSFPRPARRCVLPLWIPLLMVGSAPLPAGEPLEGVATAEKATCTRHLKLIYEAVQAYRREHKELPAWLSNLVPKFLADAEVLICPVTKRTGRAFIYDLDDPKLPISYTYEFCAKEVPDIIWGGAPLTMRDFKSLQMAIVGGTTPILRCHMHDATLNIGFDGRFYESTTTWEDLFTNVVDRSELSPSSLMGRFKISESASDEEQTSEEAEEPIVELQGKPAPNFTLKLLDGGSFELAGAKGKSVVLLDFWATWCGPCRQAMPVLAELAKTYRAKGVVYCAVNLREKPDVVTQYLKQAGLTVTVPLDTDGAVAKLYRVSGIPSMVIVDTEGVVRAVHVGFGPGMKANLEKQLEGILAARKN